MVATVWARMIFLQVIGKNAPAFTVASLAMIMQRRPWTRPMPVTAPAAGAPPCSAYMPWAAQRASSWKVEPLSMRRSIRARAVRRPFSCWRSMADLPPPSLILSSVLRNSAVRSRREGAAGVTAGVAAGDLAAAVDMRRCCGLGLPSLARGVVRGHESGVCGGGHPALWWLGAPVIIGPSTRGILAMFDWY